MSPQYAKSLKTVLVVDDDSSVVTVVHRILAVYGYQVLEARSVEEAIAAVQTSSGIDLLIVDAVMPKVSGPELADILLFLRPDLKVLFITGLDSLTIQLAFNRPCGFLQKPFSAVALIATVEEVLGESQSIAEDMSTSG